MAKGDVKGSPIIPYYMIFPAYLPPIPPKTIIAMSPKVKKLRKCPAVRLRSG